MSADGSATVFCFRPRRLPVALVDDRDVALHDGRLVPPTAPTCSAPSLATGPCPVCPRLAQEFEPYRQASYWKAMHQRAIQRATQLQQPIAELIGRASPATQGGEQEGRVSEDRGSVN